jgi:hypothetical protein
MRTTNAVLDMDVRGHSAIGRVVLTFLRGDPNQFVKGLPLPELRQVFGFLVGGDFYGA